MPAAAQQALKLNPMYYIIQGYRDSFLYFVPSWIWFTLKTFLILYLFLWIRATFPRYRYDQLMRVGWKVLIPLALANIVVTGVVKVLLGR